MLPMFRFLIKLITLRGLCKMICEMDYKTGKTLRSLRLCKRSKKNATGMVILLLLSVLLVACSNFQVGTPVQNLFSTLEAQLFPSSSMETPVASSSIPAPNPPSFFPEPSPSPQNSMRYTAVPQASSTSSPTPTPSPAPTSSSDLLYLSQNKLMRWDHVTQYASLLVDRVADYTALVDPFAAYQQPVTPDMALRNFPRLIALLRSKEVAADGTALFDLDILNLETKQIINLYEDIPKIEALQFTLQGDRLAYIDRSVDDRILVTNTSAGSQPQTIAACHREGEITCQKAFWSPDGRWLSWSDAEGIWLADQRTPTSKLIHPNRIKILDPKNQESEIKVSYEMISWSPDSRFMLLKIIPSAQGVQWYSLLDTRLSRLIDIPETADFSIPAAKIAWTYDGNLILALSGNLPDQQGPTLQLWRIVPTNNTVLTPGQRLLLGQNAPADLKRLFSSEVTCPFWLHQFGPTDFRLGLINTEDNNSAYLVRLNFEKNTLDQAMKLTTGVEKVLWAPDASGAIILSERGQVLYASFSKNELIDLFPSIGQDAHSFLWLAPAPR
jgi:hypothetical protein